MDLDWFLLGFLGKDPRPVRVAYAVSFGNASVTLDVDAQERTAALAAKFDAISVREASGVALTKQLWGAPSVHVLDPTLLLSGSDYLNIAESGVRSAGKSPSGIAAYILDSHADVLEAVRAIALSAGSTTSNLMWSESRRARRRTVGEWLAGISSAEYVLTDSYHGCLFAIIMRKPFLVIPNQSRGAERFASALAFMGLERRSVSVQECTLDRLREPIDWQTVEERLSVGKSKSLQFLRDSLLPVLRGDNVLE